MKREEREQLLKDTLLYFAPKDRYVTDEEGNVYYRDDVTLKAMELSEPPLPPAEGAAYDGMMFTISEDGINPLNEQPTAEGAEEYVLFKAKRIDTGDWVTGFFTNKKIGNLICPVIEVYKEWDSGDYMESYEIDGKTLICLHAQQIADKMVSERLREELIKYDKYIGSRGWIDNYEDWAAITSVDEYLKSREQ